MVWRLRSAGATSDERVTVESFVFQDRQLATCSTSFKCIWSLRNLTYILLQMDLESSFGVLATAGEHGC